MVCVVWVIDVGTDKWVVVEAQRGSDLLYVYGKRACGERAAIDVRSEATVSLAGLSDTDNACVLAA